MEALSPELMRLDVLLASLPEDCDAMRLSELDGFLAGILVCPEFIPPSEWLPVIWGEDGEPVFGSQSDLEEFTGLLFNHYNSIASDLMSGDDRYQPIYHLDDDEIVWETWITGFDAAMALRMDSWEAILESEDEEAASAFSFMAALVLITEGATSEELDGAKVDEISEMAPQFIPTCVQTLSDWRISRQKFTPPATGTKVGRNEPCPCGSGKKYKKCCGLN